MVAEMGGSAISTCWGQINKPYIISQRKPVLPVGCTAWTHWLFLWIPRLFWRERGWNELRSNHPPGQVAASLSRYDWILYLYQFKQSPDPILNHLMGCWNDGNQLRRWFHWRFQISRRFLRLLQNLEMLLSSSTKTHVTLPPGRFSPNKMKPNYCLPAFGSILSRD